MEEWMITSYTGHVQRFSYCTVYNFLHSDFLQLCKCVFQRMHLQVCEEFPFIVVSYFECKCEQYLKPTALPLGLAVNLSLQRSRLFAVLYVCWPKVNSTWSLFKHLMNEQVWPTMCNILRQVFITLFLELRLSERRETKGSPCHKLAFLLW